MSMTGCTLGTEVATSWELIRISHYVPINYGSFIKLVLFSILPLSLLVIVLSGVDLLVPYKPSANDEFWKLVAAEGERDESSCRRLMTQGTFDSTQRWKPNGCEIFNYTNRALRRCLSARSTTHPNYIVFIGDSRVRRLFGILSYLYNLKPHPQAPKAHFHQTAEDEDTNTTLKFFWEPRFNDAMVELYRYWSSRRSHEWPTMIITGVWAWESRKWNYTVHGIPDFQDHLRRALPSMKALSNVTSIVWMMQEPVLDHRSFHLKTFMSLSYNKAAYEVLKHETYVTIWRSNQIIADQFMDLMYYDAIHVQAPAVQIDVQILLNFYCNRHMNISAEYCCSRSPT